MEPVLYYYPLKPQTMFEQLLSCPADFVLESLNMLSQNLQTNH